MLVPIKQLFPVRLTPGESTTTILETQLPVLPILKPRIFFRNTGTASITVEIDHVLDLGLSTDPLLTGTFPTNVFTGSVGPGELLVHYFMEVALTDAPVTHRVSLTNPSGTDTVVIQMWVEGMFEESLKEAPSFLPIII
tara:strand:+ start:1701 stop:2117 length:417 start_codon:yes stop_codon:yes gene_type:complete